MGDIDFIEGLSEDNTETSIIADVRVLNNGAVSDFFHYARQWK